MSREMAVVLMVLAGAVTAVSHVILKVSARRKAESVWGEYLNLRVFSAYSLLFCVTILSVVAYRGIEYKMGPMLGLSSYIFIMVFGAAFLKEPMTVRKITRNVLIIIGIIVFSLR